MKANYAPWRTIKETPPVHIISGQSHDKNGEKNTPEVWQRGIPPEKMGPKMILALGICISSEVYVNFWKCIPWNCRFCCHPKSGWTIHSNHPGYQKTCRHQRLSFEELKIWKLHSNLEFFTWSKFQIWKISFHKENILPKPSFSWWWGRSILPSWWFQPLWKILVKMGIFPK